MIIWKGFDAVRIIHTFSLSGKLLESLMGVMHF